MVTTDEEQETQAGVQKRSWRCPTCGAQHIELTKPDTLDSRLIGLRGKAHHLKNLIDDLERDIVESLTMTQHKPPEEQEKEPPPPLELSTIPESKEASKTETPPPNKKK